jgi:hypothetical protein
MASYSRYHRTLAIEVFGPLISRDGTFHYKGEELLKFLLDNHYKIILWSWKGKTAVERAIDILGKANIEVREKTLGQKDIYYVIDIDKGFAMEYTLCATVPFFKPELRNTEPLNKVITDYHTIVLKIEERLEETKKSNQNSYSRQ